MANDETNQPETASSTSPKQDEGVVARAIKEARSFEELLDILDKKGIKIEGITVEFPPSTSPRRPWPPQPTAEMPSQPELKAPAPGEPEAMTSASAQPASSLPSESEATPATPPRAEPGILARAVREAKSLEELLEILKRKNVDVTITAEIPPSTTPWRVPKPPDYKE